MTSKKSNFLLIIASGILMHSSLLRADPPSPWYYNGWKVLAAAYGVAAAGASCASIIFFKEHKQMMRENHSQSDFLNREAQITKVYAYGSLACGIGFALDSVLLYHHSTCNK